MKVFNILRLNESFAFAKVTASVPVEKTILQKEFSKCDHNLFTNIYAAAVINIVYI